MKLIDALSIAIDGLSDAVERRSCFKGSLTPDGAVGRYNIEMARLRLTEFVNEMQPEREK